LVGEIETISSQQTMACRSVLRGREESSRKKKRTDAKKKDRRTTKSTQYSNILNIVMTDLPC
jgi:hypothetical protein